VSNFFEIRSLFLFLLILRWGWIFLQRTQILGGIHFTRHFIEFVVVQTKQFVGSNVRVILTQQTCGQRSSMAAGRKLRVPSFYFPIRFCYVFLISRCRGESDLDLRTTWVLVNRMPLWIGESGLILRPNTFLNRNPPMRSGILSAGTQIVHRPRSNSLLNFDLGNILQNRVEK